MIIINKLSVSYKNKIVINNIRHQFSQGLIHGIVGLNGAGKTTLMNAIYGLKSIGVAGNVLYKNEKLVKKDVAYLPSELFYYSNITGKEYLDLFVNDSFDVLKWNKLFKLPLDVLVNTYSSGMKKKLGFLSILKQDKAIILLDEPFNTLDIETCRIVRQIILKLKENKKTIIVTSHIIETLTDMCDLIHQLEDGYMKQTVQSTGFDEFKRILHGNIEVHYGKILSELI